MPMGMFGSPDPDLDGRYEPRMDCRWTIELPVNRAVNLTFNSFEVESSSTCVYDYVKVKNLSFILKILRQAFPVLLLVGLNLLCHYINVYQRLSNRGAGPPRGCGGPSGGGCCFITTSLNQLVVRWAAH